MNTVSAQARSASSAPAAWLKPAHILGLLLLTLLTALPPLLLVPPTSKPDEIDHWAYATHIAQTGALPAFTSPDDPTSREAHQPPLYYALAGLLTRGLGGPSAFTDRVTNPFWLTTASGNRNAFILGPAGLRSFRIGRLLSLLFWLLLPLTVLWAWLPALGPRSSLIAAALIALTPLLPFVGTSYSNDILSLVLMAVGLGGLLRLLDLRHAPQWRWSLVAGIGLGLSILTKLYALPLMIAIAVVALAPFVPLGRARRWQLLAALGLAVLMMVPWMVDSYRRLGDPLGQSIFSQVMGRDPAWFQPSKIVLVAGHAWRSFWADIGPGGIDSTPTWLALGLFVVEVIALAGIARWWRGARSDGRARAVALLLAAWVALALASFAWTFLRAGITVIAGGRNLVYLQLVNAPLLVFGLRQWLKTDHRVAAAVLAVGLVLTLWSWAALIQVYPVPQMSQLQSQPAAPLARYGSQYALLDWQTRIAGDKIGVEFDLAKTGEDATARAYFIQVVTPGGELLANLNTYPAYGALSTANVPAGTAWHESYELTVSQPIPPGSRLLLGMWAPPDGADRLPAFDGAGRPLLDSAYSAPWS